MKHRILLVISFLAFFNDSISNHRDCFSSNDCSDRSISDDCDDPCTRCSGPLSTFFRPRPVTSDLSYRNTGTFYQKYHEGKPDWFLFDATFLWQQNRRATCIGLGFFGRNPIIVAEQDGDINSVNLGLGSDQPSGFLSIVRLSPKRKVFGFLPQLFFNLDCACTGLWADIAFAVLQVKNEVCLDEKVVTPGIVNVLGMVNQNGTGALRNVSQAFDVLDIFTHDNREVGIDDIELRLGYDYSSCAINHLGLYGVVSAPTGEKFDNSSWFNPIVGSRHWGLGAGFTADYCWHHSPSHDVTVMTELKYLFKFPHSEKRMFDLQNGPLSRFLLVAREDDREFAVSGTELLRRCVKIHPKSTIEWWLGLHYQSCNWGLEASYNLYWREKEKLSCKAFDFKNFGIFDKTRCIDQTSQSTATISDAIGQGTPDENFVGLTSRDVAFKSALARSALSHTFTGALTFDGSWCNHPWSVALAARYELASRNHKTSTLENWGVFGKASISI